MVLKSSKRPFNGDDSCDAVNKHIKHCGYDVLQASHPEISSLCCDTKYRQDSFSVRELIASNIPNDSSSEDVACVALNLTGDDSFNQTKPSISGDYSTVSLLQSSSLEGCRPCLYNCSRQSHQDLPIDVFPGINTVRDTRVKLDLPSSVVSAKELDSMRNSFLTDGPTRFTSGNLSSRPWPFSSSTSEGDARFQLPVRFSSFAAEADYQTVRYACREDVYHSVFDILHRKAVAVGPNHQADIPPWNSLDSANPVGKTDDGVAAEFDPLALSMSSNLSPEHEGSSSRWSGTCLLPLHVPSPLHVESFGRHCRAVCACIDEGSVRCVRQHVMEAREKLEINLGQDRFTDLGFGDMGEVVSQKWSEEEELAFQEVIVANPASLGKNFWEHLRRAFFTRSNKEIVSYYYNVFMLRKRAEQNRLDPLNADSDNDEWQASESGESEYEDDSIVESLADGYDTICDDNSHFVYFPDESENGVTCDYDTVSAQGEGVRHDAPEVCSGGTAEDPDVQDGSCTSYEGQNNGSDPGADPVEIAAGDSYGAGEAHRGLDESDYRSDGLVCMTDPLYVAGHCDQKVWDTGYIPESGVDFLPTHNVIEAVLGKGSWASHHNAGDNGA